MSPVGAEPLLEVCNVSVDYGTGSDAVHAVRGVSLSASPASLARASRPSRWRSPGCYAIRL
jgi:hypothetical protein